MIPYQSLSGDDKIKMLSEIKPENYKLLTYDEKWELYIVMLECGGISVQTNSLETQALFQMFNLMMLRG